ncbi:MAG: ECF-type sigma factor [Phycisphaerales bacterium]
MDYSFEDLGDQTYDELRRAVARQVRDGHDGRFLDATDIVHEVWVRMSGQNAGWSDRVHFQAVASMFARRVIVDAARSRQARKRGGGRQRVGLELASTEALGTKGDALEIDDALSRLAELDPRQAMIAEHRIFGGSTTDCIARMLDLSEATVRRDWAVARAWLRATLADERSGEAELAAEAANDE